MSVLCQYKKSQVLYKYGIPFAWLFCNFTYIVSQVYFAKQVSPHCYLAIFAKLTSPICQLFFVKLGGPHCPIIKCMLSPLHSQVVNFTLLFGYWAILPNCQVHITLWTSVPFFKNCDKAKQVIIHKKKCSKCLDHPQEKNQPYLPINQ